MTGTRCYDCRVDILPTGTGPGAEYYMVHDRLWQAAITAGLIPGLDQLGPPPIDYLCIGCLEARLGRRLVADDFPAYPVNDPTIAYNDKAWSWRTPRLQNRLRTGG
jgi:hypothetical protein